jgi:glycerophosphoryl diester phosphodiesterase
MPPQVVAHRGASHDNAEHTLGAYAAALDAGADGLECDVRLTADGHLVCVHDRDLRRTAATARLVSTSELAELDDLDVASWKNPWADLDEEAPPRDERMDKLLTLRGLMELVADYDRPVELAIETKHPTRYAGLVERRLVEQLHDFGWDRAGTPVRVMSFSWKALQRVERMAPAVPLVQLIEHAHHWPVLSRIVSPDWIIGPGIRELVDHPRLGPRIAAAGHEMHVWTVNNESQLDLCLGLGAGAVITDRPAWAREQLAVRADRHADQRGPGGTGRGGRREDAAG